MAPGGDFFANGAAVAGSDGPVEPCHDGEGHAAKFKRLPFGEVGQAHAPPRFFSDIAMTRTSSRTIPLAFAAAHNDIRLVIPGSRD